MNMPAEERIRNIRRRYDATTPGRWYWTRRNANIRAQGMGHPMIYQDDGDQVNGMERYGIALEPTTKDMNWSSKNHDAWERGVRAVDNDMHFLAHAHQDIPFLLDRIEELEERIRELSGEQEERPRPKCGYDPSRVSIGFVRLNCEYDEDGNCIHCGESVPS